MKEVFDIEVDHCKTTLVKATENDFSVVEPAQQNPAYNQPKALVHLETEGSGKNFKAPMSKTRNNMLPTTIAAE